MKYPIKYSKYWEFSKAAAPTWVSSAWRRRRQTVGEDGRETPQHHPTQCGNELAKPLLGKVSFPSNQWFWMENPFGAKFPPVSASRIAWHLPDSHVLHSKVAPKVDAPPKGIKPRHIYMYKYSLARPLPVFPKQSSSRFGCFPIKALNFAAIPGKMRP